MILPADIIAQASDWVREDRNRHVRLTESFLNGTGGRLLEALREVSL